MVDPETTPNPPTGKLRGPAERLGLPLSPEATRAIKAKHAHYKGQVTQQSFIDRLRLRYEAQHLAADPTALVQELEKERRVRLGLEEESPRPNEKTVQPIIHVGYDEEKIRVEEGFGPRY